MFTAAVGPVTRISFLSQLFGSDRSSSFPTPSSIHPSGSSFFFRKSPLKRLSCTVKVSVSGGPQTEGVDEAEGVREDSPATADDIRRARVSVSGGPQTEGVDEAEGVREDSPATADDIRRARRSADWKALRAYKENGFIYEGRIEGFNAGGLLMRFYSLLGFLPYPLLSPSHSCKEPQKGIQEIAKGLVGSLISVKVIQASEENNRLIFSEKEAIWEKVSPQVKVGDVFEGRVRFVEDYGAFVHLLFPDGYYHLTGLVHVSEVSWDLVQDVRDFLNEGDKIKVKVLEIDREKSWINLSIKQLEDDPLLETLDKVIPQDGALGSDNTDMSNDLNIEPLPGLDIICKELLQEDGITDVRIIRQGFEKRVVSQDLQLWLSNAPAVGEQFTLLARAGRQVQEIHLTTTLDQDGIKKALQRVLERVP